MTSTDRKSSSRLQPGEVRTAIDAALAMAPSGSLTIREIEENVQRAVGHSVSSSSIRSSLNLREGESVVRVSRGRYALMAKMKNEIIPTFEFGNSQLYQSDCLEWLRAQGENTIHAVVTDPPYGAAEYSVHEQQKLRSRRGGIWRIPPALGGVERAPVPRFTTMTAGDYDVVEDFFVSWAKEIKRVIVPGANVIVAANPLVSYRISSALVEGGLERRGEIVRLVQTLRGGDRPKGAHDEFPDVSVMPRSQWEPWLVYRKPLEGTVAANLRKWKVGGFRRISDFQPFGDVIKSAPTRGREKAIAPHPSLKPQAFLRQIVRACLPLGQGIVLDPFAGSGSTLAAAENVGYRSIGVERDVEYIDVAREAIPSLARLILE